VEYQAKFFHFNNVDSMLIHIFEILCQNLLQLPFFSSVLITPCMTTIYQSAGVVFSSNSRVTFDFFLLQNNKVLAITLELELKSTQHFGR
jgi:hypothetical protein